MKVRFLSGTSSMQYLRASLQELLCLQPPGLIKGGVSATVSESPDSQSHTLPFMRCSMPGCLPTPQVPLKPSAEIGPSSQCVQGTASDATGSPSLSQVVPLQRALFSGIHNTCRMPESKKCITENTDITFCQ